MRTLADHITDILQNSTRAGARTIDLSISLVSKPGFISITITDDGCGIPGPMLSEITSPFTTSRKSRRFGFGLSLLRQNAELTGGTLEISSKEGAGTRVMVCFGIDNIDRQPAGDLGAAVALFITGNSGVNLTFSFESALGFYEISSSELAEALGSGELGRPSWYGPVREMISENLAELGFESLNRGPRGV